MTADRDIRISFIPVDHVVEDARAIVAAELATPRQAIYHVSGRCESAAGDILDYMCELLGLQGRLLVVNAANQTLSKPRPPTSGTRVTMFHPE